MLSAGNLIPRGCATASRLCRPGGLQHPGQEPGGCHTISRQSHSRGAAQPPAGSADPEDFNTLAKSPGTATPSVGNLIPEGYAATSRLRRPGGLQQPGQEPGDCSRHQPAIFIPGGCAAARPASQTRTTSTPRPRTRGLPRRQPKISFSGAAQPLAGSADPDDFNTPSQGLWDCSCRQQAIFIPGGYAAARSAPQTRTSSLSRVTSTAGNSYTRGLGSRMLAPQTRTTSPSPVLPSSGARYHHRPHRKTWGLNTDRKSVV